MPTTSEFNQFRRLIGDYGIDNVSDTTVISYLNDAVGELTADFVDAAGAPSPVTVFDSLVVQYHPEVILKAAINWWWMKAAQLLDKVTVSTGQAASDTSQRYDRAMQMIQALQTQYDIIQELQTDITIGNLSYWSKTSMTRLGGHREETGLE